MTIKKKNKVLWTVVCLVGILAVGVVAYAWSGNQATTVIENAGGVTINNPVQPVETPSFGSVSSPDIESQYLNVNGDITYHLTGDFINASTTIVSVANPFLMATTSSGQVIIAGDTSYGWTGATSTVEMVRLNVTGVATTSYTIYCAAAPNAYATSSASYNIVTSDAIATSSLAVIENNISSTYNNGGYGGGSIAKIMLTPNMPYLICREFGVAGSVYDGAFTETTNTFAGQYMIRISKTR